MKTGKFWFIVIFHCIVAGVFIRRQYLRDVNVQHAEAAAANSKPAEIKLPDDLPEKYDLGGSGSVEPLAAPERTAAPEQLAVPEPLAATKQAIQKTTGAAPPATEMPARSISEDPAQSAAIQTMAGLALNCPIALNLVPDPATPADTRQLQVWIGQDPSKELSIAVLVMDAFEASKLSLEASVNGAVNSIINKGVAKPTQSVMDVRISDLPAKRCSFSAVRQEHSLNMEMIAIQKALRIYIVQIIFSDKDLHSREMANAVVDSAKIVGGQP